MSYINSGPQYNYSLKYGADAILGSPALKNLSFQGDSVPEMYKKLDALNALTPVRSPLAQMLDVKPFLNANISANQLKTRDANEIRQAAQTLGIGLKGNPQALISALATNNNGAARVSGKADQLQKADQLEEAKPKKLRSKKEIKKLKKRIKKLKKAIQKSNLSESEKNTAIAALDKRYADTKAILKNKNLSQEEKIAALGSVKDTIQQITSALQDKNISQAEKSKIFNSLDQTTKNNFVSFSPNSFNEEEKRQLIAAMTGITTTQSPFFPTSPLTTDFAAGNVMNTLIGQSIPNFDSLGTGIWA